MVLAGSGVFQTWGAAAVALLAFAGLSHADFDAAVVGVLVEHRAVRVRLSEIDAPEKTQGLRPAL